LGGKKRSYSNREKRENRRTSRSEFSVRRQEGAKLRKMKLGGEKGEEKNV